MTKYNLEFRTLEENEVDTVHRSLWCEAFLPSAAAWSAQFVNGRRKWISGCAFVLLLALVPWPLAAAFALTLPRVIAYALFITYKIFILKKRYPDMRSRETFRAKWIKGKDDVLYVADHEGNVAATCAVVALDAKRCELVRVLSLVAYRGKGCASRLLHFVIAQCRQKGFEKIVVHTTQVQTDALRFYKTNDFENTSRIRIDYGVVEIVQFEYEI